MNIYDVAKRAGVSTTTVSRVLNNSERVSDKTMERVRKAMEELNYMPNQLAVGLAKNTTKTIGIMLPDVRDSFHAEVVYSIESKMTAQGYTCILCNTSAENKREIDYLNALYSKRADGIILVGSSYHSKGIDEACEQWARKIPMVLINAFSGAHTVSVVCDEKFGMVEALTHLKAQGKRHPVFIKDGSEYQKRTSVTKFEAFVAAYRKVYGAAGEPQSFTCNPEMEDYLAVLQSIRDDNFDAVLFTSDFCCAVFLKAMGKLGLKAPQDLALVGFNNARITDLTTPTITTIDYLVDAHCDIVIEKLHRLMEGEAVEKVTYVKPKLVPKETT